MLSSMEDGERPPREAPAPTPAPKAERDVVLLHSQSDSGLRVIRSRGGNLELGEIRHLREGQPIAGEVVRLAPTDHERLFEVDVVHDARPNVRPHGGPAQVTSDAYRASWDAIFGASPDSTAN